MHSLSEILAAILADTNSHAFVTKSRTATSPATPNLQSFGSTRRSVSPEVFANCNEKEATISVTLPGFSKEQVTLTRTGKTVLITGARGTGSTAFTASTSVVVPQGFDAAKITASLEHGLLVIKAPAVTKRPIPNTVRVEVK